MITKENGLCDYGEREANGGEEESDGISEGLISLVLSKETRLLELKIKLLWDLTVKIGIWV